MAICSQGAGRFVALLVALLGCSAKSPAPVVAPATASAPVPVVAPMPGSTIVASEHGLVEIDLRGVELRTLSKTPSRSPRWLPGRKQLVFLGTDGDAITGLRSFDLQAGSERSIAVLPDAPPCSTEAYAAADVELPVLSLTNESELWTTANGAHVCIVLADEPADLRDNELAISVRLSDGKLVARASGGNEVCGHEDEERPQECDSPPPGEGEPIASPFGETGDEQVDSGSPDGRWLLVLARSELHDVLHNAYVLYDTTTKLSYPLPRSGSAKWPNPIDLAKLSAAKPGAWIDALDDVEGSETVTWIGPHHLVVGRTLFIAGEAIVELPGDVAL